MTSPAAVAGIGAGLDAARIRLEYSVRALEVQQGTARDLGTQALQLIQRALSADPQVGRQLDIRA